MGNSTINPENDDLFCITKTRSGGKNGVITNIREQTLGNDT